LLRSVPRIKRPGECVQLFREWAEFGRSRPHSFISNVYTQKDKLELDDESIAYLGGSFAEAGLNTTSCLLHSFLLACAANPSVVSQAHAEFDRVLPDRPPVFNDFIELPYLFAIVKETLRWCPVTPLAFPHRAERGDQYKGYKIPAGTLVVPSIWNMHRDPSVFHAPSQFDPSRFFQRTSEGKLPPNLSLSEGLYTFGFGRRTCPGQYLALDSLWLAIGNILWTFNTEVLSGNSLPQNLDDALTWRDNVNIEPSMLPIFLKPRRTDWLQFLEIESAF